MTKPATLRDAIAATLTDMPDITMKALVARVQLVVDASKESVRNTTEKMVAVQAILRKRNDGNVFTYRLNDDGPMRPRTAAEQFKLPKNMRGPALTPMAWVAQQLGAV